MRLRLLFAGLVLATTALVTGCGTCCNTRPTTAAASPCGCGPAYPTTAGYARPPVIVPVNP